MPRHVFLKPDSKKRFKSAVESVEQSSAAEIVVSVQPWSGSYRWADLAGGSVLAYAGLFFMLFSDVVFSWRAIAANVLVLYVVGALVVNLVTPVRLFLAGPKRVHKAVWERACAKFYELGVHRTRDRSGVLVYVSLLEKKCVVLPDVGVLESISDAKWKELAYTVERSVSERGVGSRGVDAFAKSIEAMAPVLGSALPRRADDENELPDIVEA
jgi:putative membrane protein